MLTTYFMALKHTRILMSQLKRYLMVQLCAWNWIVF